MSVCVDVFVCVIVCVWVTFVERVLEAYTGFTILECKKRYLMLVKYMHEAYQANSRVSLVTVHTPVTLDGWAHGRQTYRLVHHNVTSHDLQAILGV